MSAYVERVPRICLQCNQKFLIEQVQFKRGRGVYCSIGCKSKGRTGVRVKDEVDAFLEKVERIPFSGCWIWMASLSKGEYGKFRFRNSFGRAHRVSYTLFHGEIPEGLFVLHRCDIPQCVNPNHLFLGTQKDNMLDMVEKGRQKQANKNADR